MYIDLWPPATPPGPKNKNSRNPNLIFSVHGAAKVKDSHKMIIKPISMSRVWEREYGESSSHPLSHMLTHTGRKGVRCK